MTVRFHYTTPDGVLHIITAADQATIERDTGLNRTSEDFAEFVRLNSNVPDDAVNFQRLPDDWEVKHVDEGRVFRAAWSGHPSGHIEVNMPKARDILRVNLRTKRKPLLEELDVQYIRALEVGADTAEIVNKKQKLRDITADPRIEAAQTPEELKAITING